MSLKWSPQDTRTRAGQRAAVVADVVVPVLAVVGAVMMIWPEDDVVGAVAVHGFCGAWGTLAAGLFLAGNMFDSHQIIVQLIGIGAAFVWVFVSAFVMYWLISKTIGLRVSPMHEQRGLDITEHGEIGYPEFGYESAYTADKLKDLEKI